MTPAEAQLLTDHAAGVWPDILPSTWLVGLQRHDFAETRAAIGRLRTRNVRQISLEQIADEILAARAPCQRCGGTGWVTTEEPPEQKFVTDVLEHPATVIPEPDLAPDADRVETARAWIDALRRRDPATVVTSPRVVLVTGRCPHCTISTTKETRS